MSDVPSGCSGSWAHGVRTWGRLLGIPVAVLGTPPVLISVVDGWTMMVVGSHDSESVIVPVAATLVPVKMVLEAAVVVGAAAVVLETKVVEGVIAGVVWVGAAELRSLVVELVIGGRVTLVEVETGGGAEVEGAVVEFPGTVMGSEVALVADAVGIAPDVVGIAPDVVRTGTEVEEILMVPDVTPVPMPLVVGIGIVTEGVLIADVSVALVIGARVGTLTVGRRVRSRPLLVVAVTGTVADDSVVVGKSVGRSVGRVMAGPDEVLVALTTPVLSVETTLLSASVKDGTTVGKSVGNSVGKVIAGPVEVLVALTAPVLSVGATLLGASVVAVVEGNRVGRSVGSVISSNPLEVVAVVPLTDSTPELVGVTLAAWLVPEVVLGSAVGKRVGRLMSMSFEVVVGSAEVVASVVAPLVAALVDSVLGSVEAVTSDPVGVAVVDPVAVTLVGSSPFKMLEMIAPRPVLVAKGSEVGVMELVESAELVVTTVGAIVIPLDVWVLLATLLLAVVVSSMGSRMPGRSKLREGSLMFSSGLLEVAPLSVVEGPSEEGEPVSFVNLRTTWRG